MLLKLQNEVKLGRILGPFKNMPISTLQISPIGLVPKPDGNWRLITLKTPLIIQQQLPDLDNSPTFSANSYCL
jgi:hypothetical protein